MDEEIDRGRGKQGDDRVAGIVTKSAQVQTLTATDKELAQINKLTLEPLATEDVFVYKVAMCDNEIDRTFEVFPTKSLKKMQKLFIGKTMIKDHSRSADNQVARIYATEMAVSEKEVSQTGEPYTQLVAHCYMLNTEANKGLIAEIKGGIKKEVSVGLSIGKASCSICGKDNTKDYCRHYWGKEYDGEVCHFKLEDPTDAYELSFVAVPAQPRAGTVKSYGAKVKEFDETEQSDTADKSADDGSDLLMLKVKQSEAFFFTQKQLNESEEFKNE